MARASPLGLLVLISLLLVGGALATLAFAGPTPSGRASPIGPSHSAPLVAMPSVHGDLIVNAANSPFTITPATSGSTIYVLAGNITVQSGGTLVVRGVTLEFSQFISNVGTLAQRTSHIYTFNIQGKASFDNASLTTDTTILNAFPKLSVNVSGGGSLTLTNSTFAFPGWLSAYGAGTTLLTDHSTIQGNPLIGKLVENISMIGDTVFAPMISAAGGARVTFDNSSLLDSFKDNVTARGLPGPAPLNNYASFRVNNAGGNTVSSFPMPTDSENVSRALLYPHFAGGTIGLFYQANSSSVSSGSTFTFGSAYPLGNIAFPAGQQLILVPMPAAAVAAINAVGPLGFLEATGSFEQPSSLSVHIGATDHPEFVNISLTSIFLTPVLSYNLTADGVGTTVTAADSTLDLNWNLTAGTPVTFGVPVPTPWGSNKILVTNGAAAYLASDSITHGRIGVYWNQSAVIPDAVSHAYFYRWAAVPVSASGNIPVQGAQLTAYYSYDSNQLNNQTATSLNALSTADPDLAAYVAQWDGANGVLQYGATGPNGVGRLLLATSTLDQATLPDGNYLGGYHVAVHLAGNGPSSTQWGYASVTPYPAGMTPAYADFQTPVVYTNYASHVAIGPVSVLIGGVPAPNASVDIGSTLYVQATLTNTGNAPITTLTSNFSYETSPVTTTPLAPEQSLGGLAAGASVVLNFTWAVNDTVLGHHGFFVGHFQVVSAWNGGVGPNAGIAVYELNVSLAPSPITLTFTPPPGTLVASSDYVGSGTVVFIGNGSASINITAVGSDGKHYLIGAALSPAGPFTAFVSVTSAMPSGSYTVIANATFNGRSATVTTPNAFSIAGPSSAPPSLLDTKILGIPLLYWILIAIAIVVGVLALLFVLRRQARGKLVECGECGALIPENAPSCPQCGAEFESDLVRCSRCGSTIPSDSTVCPECAAQLLGKPEDEARDPERQGYNDVVERFRAEAKKELGDNYSEGAFWDWWKRQPTYLSFSQWRLQQSQGSRAGMSAPPTSPGAEQVAASTPAPRQASQPPRRGGGAAPPAAAPSAPRAPPPSAAPPTSRPPSPPSAAPSGAAAPATAGMKPCSNCGKEIPPEYLVCPFCGAVTQ